MTLLRIGVLIIFVNLTTACSSIDRPGNESRLKSEELVLENICEVYKDPKRFHNKRLKVHTTLSVIGKSKSLSDHRCPQRHTLIDVEFASEFLNGSCNPTSEEALCLATSTIRSSSLPFEIKADYIGRLSVESSDDQFTLNGIRFKFAIERMENPGKVNILEIEKLNE